MPNLVKNRLTYILNKEYSNYYDLVSFFMDANMSDKEKTFKAGIFLSKELEQLNPQNIPFINNDTDLVTWLDDKNKKVFTQYKQYLQRRKLGGKREYFNNLSQIFEFLIKIAPVKQVDGAWLYHMVHYWQDAKFKEPIEIYLEELGCGLTKSNHVKIFNDLLESLQLDQFNDLLADDYYYQTAIQLALGYAPREFIPEILGFNLGYEQPPLHLFITNYEFKELGIDSQYFNLHLTIDNLDCGHAKSAHTVLNKVAKYYKNEAEFYRRVMNGYTLNDKGISSTDIIQNLDIQNMVVTILKRKAKIGRFVHNDSCQFLAKTLNQWLENEEEIPALLETLIQHKWIIYGENPEKSPFWRTISHPDGKMYGVFSALEQQIIYDWIIGPAAADYSLQYHKLKLKNPTLHDYDVSYLVDEKLENFKFKVEHETDLQRKINYLIPHLAPHAHHSPIGLWSTYQYTRELFPQLLLKARQSL